MEINFDPAKDAANVQERGIPLAFGAVILARAVGELEDTRRDYGEIRQRAFAEVEGKWFQCVYTLLCLHAPGRGAPHHHGAPR